MTIVIVEGTDLAGKSTFANELADRTGFKVVQGSSFQISELGANAMFNYMMHLLTKRDIIIDRFWYSNAIYGIAYGYPLLTVEQRLELKKRIDKVEATVVYLHAELETIEKRLDKRGDEYIESFHELKLIHKHYENLMGDLHWIPKDLVSLSTDRYSAGELAVFIANWIE